MRHVVITGSNKGIGFALARRCLLNHDDTAVVLACRSAQRGSAAAAKLVAESAAWRGRVSVLEMDTASDSSVAAAALKLAEALGPAKLYAICNNAGIAAGSVSRQFEVNARGPRRVCLALLPLLAPNGRVVNMSSGAASSCVSKCDANRRALLCDPQVSWAQIEALLTECEGFKRGARDFEAHGIGTSLGPYGLSKAVLNSYTMILARERPDLCVNACSPGMIHTDILRAFVPWPVPTYLVACLAGARPPDEGTKAPLFLLFGDVQATGHYFGSDAVRSPLDVYRSPGSPAFQGP